MISFFFYQSKLVKRDIAERGRDIKGVLSVRFFIFIFIFIFILLLLKQLKNF